VTVAIAESAYSCKVAGFGLACRRQEVLTHIDAIIDPCSGALGKPVGLVGMGMISRLSEDDGRVEVEVLPTFPTCMFRGVIEEQIEARVGALDWCRSVKVHFAAADRVWDESRMAEPARALLGRKDRRSA
jgi:metal-sulfur cluster biosynthetic enzyme